MNFRFILLFALLPFVAHGQDDNPLRRRHITATLGDVSVEVKVKPHESCSLLITNSSGKKELSINKSVIIGELDDIQFPDTNNFWMLFRIGLRLESAVHVTLEEPSYTYYVGQNFIFSPDKKHVAYNYPTGPYDSIVYIDRTMVYPAVRQEFAQFGMPTSRRSDSTDKIPAIQSQPTSAIYTMEWRDKSTLSFLVREDFASDINAYYREKPNRRDRSTYKGCTVKVVKDTPKGAKWGLTRQPLSADDGREGIERFIQQQEKRPPHEFGVDRMTSTSAVLSFGPLPKVVLMEDSTK